MTNEVFVGRILVNVSPWRVDQFRIREVSMQRLVKTAQEARARYQGERNDVRVIGNALRRDQLHPRINRCVRNRFRTARLIKLAEHFHDLG